jgi:murein DD-endopeptidase MepM/ murein hydrolase activator NlpD
MPVGRSATTATYDGHKGVDIRVPGVPEMLAGIPVLAAGAGVVTVARDGRPVDHARGQPPQGLNTAKP